MNKDRIVDNTTFKLISLNWPTVNPYAGLQVAGLVIGYLFRGNRDTQANVAMGEDYKNV
jgi:hypothetical protein